MVVAFVFFCGRVVSYRGGIGRICACRACARLVSYYRKVEWDGGAEEKQVTLLYWEFVGDCDVSGRRARDGRVKRRERLQFAAEFWLSHPHPL